MNKFSAKVLHSPLFYYIIMVMILCYVNIKYPQTQYSLTANLCSSILTWEIMTALFLLVLKIIRWWKANDFTSLLCDEAKSTIRLFKDFISEDK